MSIPIIVAAIVEKRRRERVNREEGASKNPNDPKGMQNAKYKNITIGIALVAILGYGAYSMGLLKQFSSKTMEFSTANSQQSSQPETKDKSTKEESTKEESTSNTSNTSSSMKLRTAYSRQLISQIDLKNINIDIFRDTPAFKFGSRVILEDEGISKDGKFILSNIRIDTHSDALKDVVLLADIIKDNIVVTTIKEKLDDYFLIEYYEGGINIKSKMNAEKTGVVLEGEKLCSLFKIKKSEITDEAVTFIISFFDGSSKKYTVDIEEIL